jgi:hypothetical protein
MPIDVCHDLNCPAHGRILRRLRRLQLAVAEKRRLETSIEALHGTHDPDGGDGYLPGAWDEVRSAYLDGNISESAYQALWQVIGNKPREAAT